MQQTGFKNGSLGIPSSLKNSFEGKRQAATFLLLLQKCGFATLSQQARHQQPATPLRKMGGTRLNQGCQNTGRKHLGKGRAVLACPRRKERGGDSAGIIMPCEVSAGVSLPTRSIGCAAHTKGEQTGTAGGSRGTCTPGCLPAGESRHELPICPSIHGPNSMTTSEALNGQEGRLLAPKSSSRAV